MAYLQARALTKKYDGVTVVNAIDFDVEQGEMIAILGASGCGKTTTLRMISGFTTPTSGSIELDGKIINDTPSHKRNIGMFFQNYALFPHLTAYENIAFGLKLQKRSRADIQRRVTDALRMVRLEGLENRLPRALSGGQQQRVALARALVMEPRLLLLDEPLSNLDAKLRTEMQVELKRIHLETGITAVIVTHDQEEAMSLAGRIIIMQDGHIRQNDTPTKVYNRPADPAVANFMGISNFIDAVVESVGDDSARIRTRGGLLEAGLLQGHFLSDDSVIAAIRADHVVLTREALQGAVPALVLSSTYKGNFVQMEVDCVYGGHFSVRMAEDIDFQEGDKCFLSLPSKKLLLYTKQQEHKEAETL
ncbi:ABC transporter ATP-binding protein [Clostridia bacterium]|nr:ABC transporter ATP-binding protein [Clostridia bacterium]